MRKWRVYLPNNKRFELESDTPAADLTAQGYTEFGLMEIPNVPVPVAPTAPTPSTVPEGPMLLTVSQAAKLLQVGRDTMYNLTHRRDFPAVRIGRNVRINREQLQSWLNDNNGGILL